MFGCYMKWSQKKITDQIYICEALTKRKEIKPLLTNWGWEIGYIWEHCKKTVMVKAQRNDSRGGQTQFIV